MSRWRPHAFVVLTLGALLLAYVPDMGRGFIKDDFAWIDASRVGRPAALVDLFRRDNGFYRPLVALSFTLNAWLFDLRPFGYAATNLLLVVLGAAALARLAQALGLGAAASLLAACLWALSPHGVGLAVMWISGRTSLLLTLFAVLAALASVRGRPFASALLAFLALLCKEEATLLPVVLAAWAALLARPGGRRVARAGLVTLVRFAPGLALYLVLRAGTSAAWPHTAPDFYRPTLDPATLLRNVLEYADRAATFPLAIVLLAALVAGAWPRPVGVARRVIPLGLAWLVGGYGLTVFLPVRSSLYACFPAVGAALAGAALLDEPLRAAGPRAARRLTLGAALVLVALVPLLHARNQRLRRTAGISARALAAVADSTPELVPGTTLVLRDDDDARVNLRAAFGTLARTAVRVQLGLDLLVWIEPPPEGWREAGLFPPRPGPRVEYALRHGDVVRVR